MNTTIFNLIDIIKAVPETHVLTGNRNDNFVIAAASKGLIFDEKAITEEAEQYLNHRVNPNTTFYQNWKDIVTKSRWELALDQIRHYASTYGTNFTGEAYVPNDDLAPFIPFEQFTFIPSITMKDAFEKCMDMLASGIALKETTSAILVNFIVETANANGYEVDVDRIKNKEAQIRICQCLGITPKDKFALLRYIMYLTTGKTTIIQNDDTFNMIRSRGGVFQWNCLTDEQLHGLASIFYRFKKIFLAFRHTNPRNTEIINKIRRYAVKDHTPFHAGIMQTVLSWTNDSKVPTEKLKECTSYELVRLIQAIRERYLIQDGDYKQYVIRNGKTFNTPAKAVTNKDFLTSLEMVANAILVSRMKGDKSKIYILPEGLHLVAPTSEKNFIGAYPVGSYVPLGENSYVGVYWRGEWGTRDFDLHFIDLFGNHYGWNGNYRNGADLIFSGDMTTANPEATEVYYCHAGIPDGIFTLNRFSGREGSQYKMFFAANDKVYHQLDKGYMVDPNDIIAEAPMISNDKQVQLGFTVDGRFYFADNAAGNTIIPKYNKNLSVEICTNIIRRKMNAYIELDDLLKAAGHTVMTQKEYEEYRAYLSAEELETLPEVVDLSNVSKEQIISLFNVA